MELPSPQTSAAGDSTWPGRGPGTRISPWHHLSASALGVQSLGSKTAATEKAGGAWLPLPDPRAPLANPVPSLARREGPSPEAGTSWRVRKWRPGRPQRAGGTAHLAGRVGAASRGRGVRVPRESPPGSATRGARARGWRPLGPARPAQPAPRPHLAHQPLPVALGPVAVHGLLLQARAGLMDAALLLCGLLLPPRRRRRLLHPGPARPREAPAPPSRRAAASCGRPRC